MGLVARLKVLLRLKDVYKKVKESYMTKGMKSTEFWMTVVAQVITFVESIQGNLDPKTAIIIVSVLNCIYTIGRSLVKKEEASAQ